MAFRVIETPGLDPAKNFEIEESLARGLAAGETLLRFWRCSPCVAVGRFQRVEWEVSSAALGAGLPVMRRVTGGGAVYLDPGCLLVSVMRPRARPLFSRLVKEESRALAAAVGAAVAPSGLTLSVDERGGLFLPDGRKVAGTACALLRETFLWHLSLLVSTDLAALAAALRPDPPYPASGAFIPSKRSPVANLSERDPALTMDAAKARLRANLEPLLGG